MVVRSWLDIPGETPEQDVEFILGFVRGLPGGAVIVELGALAGRLTVAMAITRPDCRIYTVDRFHKESHIEQGGWVEPSRQNLEANLVEVKNVEIIEGDTYEVGFNWRGPAVGLLVHDAGHGYDEVCGDLRAWLPNMKAGGIICLHDFNNRLTPGVEKAAREILGEPDQVYWLTAVYILG